MSFPQWEEQQGAEVTELTLRGLGSSWKTENHELQQHFRKYAGTANLSYNTDGSIRMLICACLPDNSTNMRNKELPVRWVLACNLKYFYMLPQIRLLSQLSPHSSQRKSLSFVFKEQLSERDRVIFWVVLRPAVFSVFSPSLPVGVYLCLASQ